MEVRQAEFVKSSSKLNECPDPDRPEYAFIGRSNVGKSSLINMLTGRKKLAKTSGNPGKTQLINHFLIDETWYLVDLPGYGYAKVSKSQRSQFHKLITNYLEKRTNLLCAFVLLDSRLPPQPIDLEFMEWLGQRQIPFVMVFTKADKLKGAELTKNLLTYASRMLESWEALPTLFKTSSTDGMGRNEILSFIDQTNPVFQLP